MEKRFAMRHFFNKKIISVLSVLFLLSAFHQKAIANSQKPFEVSNIHIQGISNVEEKKRLIQKAKLDGLKILIKRLTVGGEEANVNYNGINLSSLVKKYKISHEKVNSNFYSANVSVEYSPHKIKEFLQQQNITYVATSFWPVLVLPIYFENGKYSFWPDTSTSNHDGWYKAWNHFEQENGLTQFNIPIADLEDIQTISIEGVLNRNLRAFRQISERYQVTDILVIIAEKNLDRFDITVNRYGSYNEEPFIKWTSPIPVSEQNQDLFYKSTIKTISAIIESKWKRENLFQKMSYPLQKVKINIPLQSLNQWAQLRKRIKSLTLIENYDVLSFAQREAILELQVRGIPEKIPYQLQQAFKSIGGELISQSNGYLLKMYDSETVVTEEKNNNQNDVNKDLNNNTLNSTTSNTTDLKDKQP